MQSLSTRLKFVNTSVTAKINNLVLSKQKAGERVLGLSVGEPDFETPENIKKAAGAAIKNGLTRYTATDGVDKLKAAIATKFQRDNSLNFDSDELIVCSGGKQVMFNALLATLNPQDEVVIPAPFWVSYPDIVRLCGATPRIVKANIESNFKMKPSNLKNALNRKTKWLILNYPSNPSGNVYTEEELLNFSEILEQFPHVNIMSDDIYEHLIFEEKQFFNILQVNPKLKPRTLLVNGLSKSHAMTGWRVGYGAANKELVKAMTTVQSQSTSNATSISQYAAIEALTGPQNFITENKLIYQNRRDLMLNILSRSTDIETVKPMGAFYALPSIKALIGKTSSRGKVLHSGNDFVTELLEETGVAVVPGEAFGVANTFRISYATSESIIIEACDLIVDFTKNLK
jgi:aspartate aminotransferase